MSEMITLSIDDHEVTVPKGTTILEAAETVGISIPVVCFHPHLTANGLCRVCSVDVGWRVQAAACVAICQDGMEVITRSPEVDRGRRTILELLASTVDLSQAPNLLALIDQYEADPNRFSDGDRRESPIFDDNPFYVRDYNQCINCWRCVQVCADDAQFAYALTFDGRGYETRIGTFMGAPMTDTTCVFCGQCVGVCPTGALKPKRQQLLERGVDPDEIFYQTRPRKGRVKRKK